MKVIVDRIEGDMIVVELEAGKTADLPLVLAPNAKEGDIIEINLDHESTISERKKVENLMNDLFVD